MTSPWLQPGDNSNAVYQLLGTSHLGNEKPPAAGDERKALKPKIYDHIRENAIGNSIHLDFINGVEDHVHALVSLQSAQSIADVVQSLKGESSRWVNKKKFDENSFWLAK